MPSSLDQVRTSCVSPGLYFCGCNSNRNWLRLLLGLLPSLEGIFRLQGLSIWDSICFRWEKYHVEVEYVFGETLRWRLTTQVGSTRKMKEKKKMMPKIIFFEHPNQIFWYHHQNNIKYDKLYSFKCCIVLPGCIRYTAYY